MSMLTDDVIDEDIEALLYSQVYYGKPTEPELAPTDNINSAPIENTADLSNISISISNENRIVDSMNYQDLGNKGNTSLASNINQSNPQPSILEKPITSDTICSNHIETAPHQQQFIEISTSSPSLGSSDKSPQIVAQIPILSSPSTGSNQQQQLLNNITINQYIYPSADFLDRLKEFRETIWSKRCEKDLKRYQKGKLNEKEFFKLLKRRMTIQKNRLKKQELIRSAFLKRKQKIASSEVICLSDSDNSDIEFVGIKAGDKNSSKMLKTPDVANENVADNTDEDTDDDEIIYVAPPPAPLINVDDSDSPSESLVEKSLEKPPPDHDEASNDFLVPTNTATTEKFNFSLHGSEFQDAEFVRPANPTDSYETESSTSTSDFNRDSTREFVNSVKTIVFNEVDFPKDIFEGNSLEKFGEMITPKRSSTATEEKDIEKTDDASTKAHKRVHSRESSESSSESDYDYSEIHSHLPDLSPMIAVDASTRKSNKNKGGEKKRRKNTLSEGNDILNSDVLDERNRKARKRSSTAMGQEAPKKKVKKKKKKSGNKSPEDADASLKDTTDLEDLSEVGSSQRSFQHDILPTNTPKSSNMNPSDLPASKKKNKKKKKQAVPLDDSDKIAQPNDQLALEGFSKKKSKKKKGSSKSIEHQFEISTDNLNNSTNKKGPKKRKRRLRSEEQEDNDPMETAQQVDNTTISVHESDGSGDIGKKRAKKRKQKLVSEDGNNPTESLGSKSTSEIEADTSEDSGKKTGRKPATETEAASLEDNCKKKAKKRKQTLISEESSVPDEEINDGSTKSNNASYAQESCDSGKKNKKKRISSDKTAEEIAECLENVSNDEEIDVGQEDFDLNSSKPVENQADAKVLVENQEKATEEEDIVLIEPIIPTHTIESSSEDEDIITFHDAGDDLQLANIKGTKLTDTEPDKFDISYLQSKMSDDPDKWGVLPTDRYFMNVGKKGPRCNKCRQFGHIAIHCPNKPDIPNCNLCGGEGHQEPRCPNKICLICGTSSRFNSVYCYKCANRKNAYCCVCSMKGHNSLYCPDQWRRYYLTIKEGELVKPPSKRPMIRGKRWCSGCASRGHFEHECESYKWIRQYPAANPKIFSYYNVYNEDTEASPSDNVVDLREKLLQNRSKITEASQVVDVREPSSENIAHLQQSSLQKEQSIESQQELTEPENQSLNSEPPLAVNDNNRETPASITFEAPQPLTSDATSNSDIILESQQPAMYVPLLQQNMSRQRDRQQMRGRGKAKLNPLSILRPNNGGFTPYQSVLNPYSVMGANPINPIGDLGGFRVDTSRAPAQNQLFNSVPNGMVAQQVSSLINATVQNVNQTRNYYGRDEGYSERHQYMTRTSTNYANFTYLDFNDVLPDDRYYEHPPFQNNYYQNNRDYLNVPYTITREPEPFRPPSQQQNNVIPLMDITINPPVVQQEGFLPIAVSEKDNLDISKTLSMNNVEEATANKFCCASLEELIEFIGEEVKKLDGIKKAHINMYKKYLNQIDQLKTIELKTAAVRKRLYFQFKRVNMFLFGAFQLDAGKKYIDFLRNFLVQPGRVLNHGKRRSLLEAYGYIFGGEHPNVNYRKLFLALSDTQKRNR